MRQLKTYFIIYTDNTMTLMFIFIVSNFVIHQIGKVDSNLRLL